jgi:hypothetical protein
MLVAGDADALRAMHGTDGLEAPPDRKIRFLEQGLLLEYRQNRTTTVRVHPLLEAVVGIAPAKAKPARAKKTPARKKGAA